MKIFVDSANLAEIDEALARGFVAGITTNPSILAREERTDFTEHIHKIIGLIRSHGREIPLSVEVFSDDPAEMLDQALKFVAAFRYPALSVKVPIGWDELRVIAELRRRDILVNCTCCMDFGYAPGTKYEQTQYYPELRELFGDRLDEAFIRVENPVTGETWLTDPAYYWFRDVFFEMAREADCETVNCTEGGILCGPEMKAVTLEEFVNG